MLPKEAKGGGDLCNMPPTNRFIDDGALDEKPKKDESIIQGEKECEPEHQGTDGGQQKEG